MRVEHLYRYPVKGLTPEALDEIAIEAGRCIAHDRRFALAQGDAPFDPAAPKFVPKQNFACMMAHPRVSMLARAKPPKGKGLSSMFTPPTKAAGMRPRRSASAA
ncbi:MOSC N-terminal beta barrel domain-containing protein [Rhodovarius sp.]|uniref:MOSC N-terminal beta barrel domain-containing protein n=1 Tax=Rhodovarius sp. TaxID=2972673 RepID=UPI0034A57F6E